VGGGGRSGGGPQSDGLDHVEHLRPGEGAGGVEVVAARAVHPRDQLTHVRREVVLGRHFGRRADRRLTYQREQRLLRVRELLLLRRGVEFADQFGQTGVLHGGQQLGFGRSTGLLERQLGRILLLDDFLRRRLLGAEDPRQLVQEVPVVAGQQEEQRRHYQQPH